MPPRNQTIDSMRLLAVFFVVGIHSFPFYFFEEPVMKTIGLVINQVCRFAVPAFFVISGYLYTRNFDYRQPRRRLWRTARRLLFLYAFWCLFYLLPYNVALIPGYGLIAPWESARWHFAMWTANPEAFFLGGSKTHLWFLSALLCAVVISTPFIALRKIGLLVVVSLLVFAIALLAAPYSASPWGLDLGFFTRNGPFLSLVFFTGGAVLAHGSWNPARMLNLGYALLLLGLCWHLAEFFWLRANWESLKIYDFNSGTLAFGLGAAMLGIYGARPLRARWLVRYSYLSLGVYLLHMCVLDFFIPISRAQSQNVAWNLALPFIVIVLSIGLVSWLLRYRACRRVLS